MCEFDPLPMETELREGEAQLGSPRLSAPCTSSPLLGLSTHDIQGERINDYLHLTKREESKFFPPLVGVKAAGRREPDITDSLSSDDETHCKYDCCNLN